MVFVIDTTGQWAADRGRQAEDLGDHKRGDAKAAQPRVRVGLVAFRDHGDSYVTKVLPLTEDLDQVYSNLMDYTRRRRRYAQAVGEP